MADRRAPIALIDSRDGERFAVRWASYASGEMVAVTLDVEVCRAGGAWTRKHGVWIPPNAMFNVSDALRAACDQLMEGGRAHA